MTQANNVGQLTPQVNSSGVLQVAGGGTGLSAVGTSGYVLASNGSANVYVSAVGYSGYSGYSGTNGSNGASGISGYSGATGTSGYSGATGSNGSAGTSGYSGYSGAGASTTAGAVGAYTLAGGNNQTTYTAGSTVAGSSLYYFSLSKDGGSMGGDNSGPTRLFSKSGALSGTWRCMAYQAAYDPCGPTSWGTLWCRIS